MTQQFTEEGPIQQQMRLDLGGMPNVKLFRNNVGKYKAESGRWVDFGLIVGSGDLIGWKSVLITPEMVGTTMAQFLSIEVKRLRGGSKAEAQKTWARNVVAAGGLAGFARSTEEAEAILAGRGNMG